jgi:hypothetical protein
MGGRTSVVTARPARYVYFSSREIPLTSSRGGDQFCSVHDRARAMSSSDADAAVGLVRTAWKRAEPNHSDYGLAVAELNSSQMVGNGSVFERGNHVPVTHLTYFKPPASAFLSELRAKDRRSAKEWEYVNAAGVWVELGQTALDLARDGESVDKMEDLARRLELAEKAISAAREVLAIRAQYFLDIVGHCVEAARQMSFPVEQGHDAVHSSSHECA